MSVIDLHIHTTFSDGELDGEKLSYFIINNDISVASITDHDSVEFYKNSYLIKSTKIIPGIELTSKYHDAYLHILGYYIDPYNPLLNQYLSEYENEQRLKTIKFMRAISRMHLPVEFKQEILKKRIRMIQIKKTIELMNLDKSIYYEIDGIYSSLQESNVILQSASCAKLIRDSGGLAFIAHPQLYCESECQLEKIIHHCNVDGIECYTPHHDKTFTDMCLSVAEKYSLLISGGSDYHCGAYNKLLPFKDHRLAITNINKLYG